MKRAIKKLQAVELAYDKWAYFNGETWRVLNDAELAQHARPSGWYSKRGAPTGREATTEEIEQVMR